MPRLPVFLMLCAALVPATLLTACGGDDTENGASTTPTTPTAAGIASAASTTLTAPRAATKNTTRIDAADAASIAATTALTMYPSSASDLRPDAVALAGSDDWRSILLAASFAARPLGWPLLLVDGRDLPPVTSSTLAVLRPKGARAMNGAQAIRVGVAAQPVGLRTRYLTSSTPAGLARAVDRQLTKARDNKPSSRVLIVNSEDPASAAPAAAWAAVSGDPILFAGAGTLPADTKAALLTHENPRIYILGGQDTISRFVSSQLQEYGSVRRIEPGTADGGPADLAIAFAKYSDGDFGFNFRDPGHGLVFASTKDPTAAMAASGLSSAGTYGALLYVDRPDHVEPALRSYLLDIQPGYNDSTPPTAGFYNRGWIIGGPSAIEEATQARLDQLLEIVKTETSTGTTTQIPATPTGTTP